MRVLLAIPCLMRGGTEMQTLYLTKALVAAGHEVEIVCYHEFDSSVVEDFIQAGCRAHLLELPRSGTKAQFIKVMKAFYLESNPDVLHVQYMTPGALSILAARLAGLSKIFATVHQPYTKGHGLMALLLLRSSALLCDRFMAVSKVAELSWFGSATDLLSGRRWFSTRHCTIHNAIDTKKVASLSTKGLEADIEKNYHLDGCFVFGYIGRLSYEKGVDILFDAFGQLAEARPEVRLLVVGTGIEKKNLQEKFGTEKWWSKIVFAGSQSWVNAMMHLSLMDAVVVPSRFEGFGLSAAEAMAASKPVIAARTGGLMEIIDHELSGLLYSPENSSELMHCMTVLVDDQEICHKISANACIRASCFDVEIYNNKVKEVYGL